MDIIASLAASDVLLCSHPFARMASLVATDHSLHLQQNAHSDDPNTGLSRVYGVGLC
jgi:hypothetical protein